MAQREGSVSFYLFIVASVLFIVMAVLFFVTNAELQDVTADLVKAERDIGAAEDRRRELVLDIEDLRELIAGERAAEWEDNDLFIKHFREEELKGKAESAINNVLNELKEQPRSYDTLVSPYADLQSLFQSMLQERTEALAVSEQERTSRLATVDTSEKELEELRASRDRALQQVQELERQYEDLDNTAQAREAELLRQIEEQRDQWVVEVTKLRRDINFKDNEIRSLQNRLEKLQAQIFAPDSTEGLVADGKIQYVLAASDKAWIDLGRQDHLTKGLKFRVFQTVKGGKKVVKGEVEVTRVDEDMSEVRIIEERDSLDPIVAGDGVASPFYDPDATPVFVFAGELQTTGIPRELVEEKMRKYGAEIRETVDQSTDFLVATKGYENTPEYKAARELGVKIISERDLLEFVGQ